MARETGWRYGAVKRTMRFETVQLETVRLERQYG